MNIYATIILHTLPPVSVLQDDSWAGAGLGGGVYIFTFSAYCAFYFIFHNSDSGVVTIFCDFFSTCKMQTIAWRANITKPIALNDENISHDIPDARMQPIAQIPTSVLLSLICPSSSSTRIIRVSKAVING